MRVKKSDRYSYSTQFTVVNMTARSLKIQLNFSAPLNVSADSESDVLIVKFRRTFYTSVNQLPVVYLKNDIAISKQKSDNKYEEMVSNALESSVPMMNVGSLFVNFG